MENSMSNKPGVILIAEDNPADQRIITRALNTRNGYHELIVVEDGVETMEFLRREGKYADPAISPKPNILLLDIKMPRMDGKEVLQEIKNDPVLKSIPVVMLSTSNQEEDITKSYDLGANAYITKPDDFAQFIQMMSSLKYFWFCVARLAPKSE